MGSVRWAVLSLAALALLLCMETGAQENAAAGLDEQALTLSSKPTKDTIRRGEPLFIKVELKNNGAEAQHLLALSGSSLGEMPWYLEIAEDQGPFRRVELRAVQGSFGVVPGAPMPLIELKPGKTLTDCLTIWFAATGELPDERSLVFVGGGAYRYRITFMLRADAAAPYQSFPTEGRIRITARPKGFSPFVRGLRGIMFDDVEVSFKDRGKLEALLDDKEVKDSPYADFVKWLRIRSYLRDGILGDNDILESGGRRARREMALLTELSDDLLKNPAQKDLAPPIWRDAMLARGMVHLFSDRKAEAIETLKQVDAESAEGKESEKLRRWAR
jgi:hypothetical protein